MAATTLRYEGSNNSWLAAAGAMVALAVGLGYALAMGEVAGLYVALALIGSVAVLLDFRIGAMLLLVMLPASSSTLFPHSLMQITGLNPLNLLFLATFGAYVIGGRMQRRAGALVPMPLAALFIAPIVGAGLIGMQHVAEIPSFFYETGTVTYYTGIQYLLTNVVKPMIMVGVILVIGAAAARSEKPERFIVPLALSMWPFALIQIGFVIIEGPSLALLAQADERAFYAPLGLHANDLGRLHLFAFALLLFIWAETKHPRLKLFLLMTLGLIGFALMLTFSRASIAGAMVVGALFLMWKFNARTLALAIIGVVLIGAVGAEAIYSRMTLGFDQGADAVSAGRIDNIWLPLLPEIWKSPLWGSGLESILWSFPMVNESMLRVGHPHNAYLEVLLDMGLLGCVLLGAYYWSVWKGFRRFGADASLSPELRGLFQGATAGLLTYFVTCLVGSSLRPDPALSYLWIAVGLMYGMRARRPAR